MIFDASIRVAIFRADDLRHAVSLPVLETAIAADQDLHVPNLALAEISGGFSPQTGSSRLASQTVRAVLAMPRLQRHAFTNPMPDRAAILAAS
jgi:predicted nucleic acid-binding protein